MQPVPPPSTPEAPFPYGWRYVKKTLPSGEVELEQVPLTLEDVLHPQEGDVIPERPSHELHCRYLADVFGARLPGPPVSTVTADLLIDWGVPGLRNHSPDIGVFVGLTREVGPDEGILHLRDLGGRCLLVVEVVSPDTRVNDVVHKVGHYYLAGVALYVVIDWEREGKPRRLRVFRASPGGYREEAPDRQGRVLLPALGLYLSLREDRPVCHDSTTGQELGDNAGIVRKVEQLQRDLEQADRRNQEQEQALEQAIEGQRHSDRERRLADERTAEAQRLAEQQTRAREEAERLAQEAQRQKQDAERLAEQQKRAREDAERLAEQQARARQDAERQAQLEARGRQAAEQRATLAEDRIKQMEELIRQLQGNPPAAPPA
jgi:Uma2 family endonuclease